MKVLVINPWDGNIAAYTNALVIGLTENDAEVYLFTNKYDCYECDRATTKKVFFRYTEKMISKTLFRKLLRGMEYVWDYVQILNFVKKKQFDVIHIQWCLLYSADIFFLNRLKKHTSKLVLTAHNVVPHVNGKKYIGELNKLYNVFDLILVHGENIKKEFNDIFPQLIGKVRIQHHGCFLNKDTAYNIKNIPNSIIEKTKQYKRIYLFAGTIFYNKGTDILMEIWNESFRNKEDALLVVAGRRTEHFNNFDYQLDMLSDCENFLYLDGYIDDDVMNYLMSVASVIILPYRHASMSGVIFTAASFKTTVLCTDVGSLSEYVDDGENAFLCQPNKKMIQSKLIEIHNCVSDRQINNMGEKLLDVISTKYSWNAIAKNLLSLYEDKNFIDA